MDLLVLRDLAPMMMPDEAETGDRTAVPTVARITIVKGRIRGKRPRIYYGYIKNGTVAEHTTVPLLCISQSDDDCVGGEESVCIFHLKRDMIPCYTAAAATAD